MQSIKTKYVICIFLKKEIKNPKRQNKIMVMYSTSKCFSSSFLQEKKNLPAKTSR